MTSNDNASLNFKHSPSAPFDPRVFSYFCWDGIPNVVMPWEYTSWQDETLSWKENCYIAAALSDIMPCDKVVGPEATKLMSYMCVNNFDISRFPIGAAKHVIVCTPKGTISAHGVCLRIGENEYDTYGIQPDVAAYVNSGQYDVEPLILDYEKDIVYQLAGPRSLEVVENTFKQDLHDLKFMQFRAVQVQGCDARVLRMGMGGTLAYEIHASAEHKFEIYNEILRVGQAYDIHKLGFLSYMCDHTENGFPQGIIHFMCDWESNPLVAAYNAANSSGEAVLDGADFEAREMLGGAMAGAPLHGSLASEGREAYYLNPIEAGWRKMIHWGHDFIGKEALMRIANDPSTRQVVTLEWLPEDILKVYAAFFEPEGKLPNLMRFPQDLEYNTAGNLADKIVDQAGRVIGKSGGRVYTQYYRKVISMAFIAPEYAELGKEVTVIWGDPDKLQIPIRAKVARFPYLDLPRNVDFSIDTIPRYGQ